MIQGRLDIEVDCESRPGFDVSLVVESISDKMPGVEKVKMNMTQIRVSGCE